MSASERPARRRSSIKLISSWWRSDPRRASSNGNAKISEVGQDGYRTNWVYNSEEELRWNAAQELGSNGCDLIREQARTSFRQYFETCGLGFYSASLTCKSCVESFNSLRDTGAWPHAAGTRLLSTVSSLLCLLGKYVVLFFKAYSRKL